jgi:hypothetical protein
MHEGRGVGGGGGGDRTNAIEMEGQAVVAGGEVEELGRGRGGRRGMWVVKCDV